jgi:hypothetical protein
MESVPHHRKCLGDGNTVDGECFPLSLAMLAQTTPLQMRRAFLYGMPSNLVSPSSNFCSLSMTPRFGTR